MAISSYAPLVAPLRYLRIWHPAKAAFDLVLPVVAVAGVWLVAHLTSGLSVMCGESGVFAAFTDLIQIFSGFYITALAAIASLARPELDELMERPAPTLPMPPPAEGADPEHVPLSRRRFLCFLFGYLAFSSLVLYFAGRAGASMMPICALDSPAQWQLGVSVTLSTVYLLWASHLIVTTLLGIWYLTDRMHRGNVHVTSGGDARGDDR